MNEYLLLPVSQAPDAVIISCHSLLVHTKKQMHALKRLEDMPNEIQVSIVWLCVYYKLATQQGKVDDT